MIKAEEVSVAYERNIILRRINLDIKAQEFVVIVGPNGSGKTTLLTMINHLAKVRGNLWVSGQRVSPKTLRSLRKGIAYVPQHWAVDPRIPLCVEDMILSGRCGQKGLFTAYSRKDRREARDIARRVGIEPLWDRPVGQLSGGEFQKATIGRAIFQNPFLLLLDEPTSSLDWQAARELIELVYDLHQERQLTTLMVTHELLMIPPFATRIIVLRNGAIVADGSPDEILKRDIFVRLLGWELPF
jgi:ABC-type cobalamin/Fe3+-siderophores transport system ATPase subunit